MTSKTLQDIIANAETAMQNMTSEEKLEYLRILNASVEETNKAFEEYFAESEKGN